jgi:hypothetical protein
LSALAKWRVVTHIVNTNALCFYLLKSNEMNLLPGFRWMDAPILVAMQSKAGFCGRSLADIVGSDPTGSLDVCLL